MTSSDDFTRLTGEFRSELLVHCYRMMGSADEAEDLVQETYLRAWKGYAGFEGRSSVRTWLYRIATNACLTAVERRGRRPLPSGVGGPAEDPRAPVVAALDVPWLQPMPGGWLEETRDDPAAVAAARAGTRLALVAAWQYLPARQRAFLILRDVLEWPADEVADLLGTTTTAVNSGLRRARALVARALPAQDDVAEPAGEAERALLNRFAAAFEDADVPALAGLLRDDVVLEMPPVTAWFSGRGAVLTFVAEKVLTTRGRFRLRPARANGQPAFAVYLRAEDGTYRAHAVQVLAVAPGGIARLDIFLDPGLFRVFGLPAQLGEPMTAGAATAGPAAGLPG
jgi:RNA polymerase sigma-70 factor, ECF subfamily